jgi:excisionase family DNA binding protein
MDALRVTQAAKYIGVSKSTLDKLRVYGGGPVYLKLGKRVIYDRADLDRWLSEKRRASTSALANDNAPRIARSAA